MTEIRKHIDFLDVLRGVAILFVFLHHAVPESARVPWNGWSVDTSHWGQLALFPLSWGWIGVPLFFVISGFCIHINFEQQGKDWGRFFMRRLFRIYPPYLMAVLLFAVVVPNTRLDLSHYSWRQVWSHCLLVQNFSPTTFYGLNPSFWSIAVEAQLYLLYPVLLWIVRRIGWRWVMLLLLAIELFIRTGDGAFNLLSDTNRLNGLPPFALFFVVKAHWLRLTPFAYWFSWAIGAYIADAWLKNKPLPLVNTPIILWSVLMVGSLSCKFTSLDGVPAGVGLSFIFAALLTAAGISKLLRGDRPFISLPKHLVDRLRFLGVLSYSLYLVHQPLMETVSDDFLVIFPDATLLTRLFIGLGTLVLLIPLGMVWHRLFEKNSISFGKRLLATPQPA